jgi:hypothetical protein
LGRPVYGSFARPKKFIFYMRSSPGGFTGWAIGRHIGSAPYRFGISSQAADPVQAGHAWVRVGGGTARAQASAARSGLLLACVSTAGMATPAPSPFPSPPAPSANSSGASLVNTTAAPALWAVGTVAPMTDSEKEASTRIGVSAHFVTTSQFDVSAADKKAVKQAVLGSLGLPESSVQFGAVVHAKQPNSHGMLLAVNCEVLLTSSLCFVLGELFCTAAAIKGTLAAPGFEPFFATELLGHSIPVNRSTVHVSWKDCSGISFQAFESSELRQLQDAMLPLPREGPSSASRAPVVQHAEARGDPQYLKTAGLAVAAIFLVVTGANTLTRRAEAEAGYTVASEEHELSAQPRESESEPIGALARTQYSQSDDDVLVETGFFVEGIEDSTDHSEV